MNDLISRSWLLDVVENAIQWDTERDRNLAIHHVRELTPSAQPERIRGRWVYGEDEHGIDGYHCNKCGFFAPWDYTHKFIDFIKDYHFCPHCGADMRKDE